MKKDSIVRLGVAYCRVSTDHEEQKKSIQEQQAQWLEKFKEMGSQNATVGLICHREIRHIDKNGKAVKGKLITESRTDGLYIDEGISGKSLKNRKAFEQMIADAKLRKFDMIYCEDVSRFSRSMEDGYSVIKDLREIGIGVYFRKEGWDSLDLSKDFELQLRLSIAQEENRTKSDRVKWAMDRLRQKGGWSSTAPYGYDKVKGFLQINPNEAEYVKMIFNWYGTEHWGQAKIARKLNEINAPSKRGGEWKEAQIYRILNNVIYTGRQITHRTETYDITRHSMKDIDKSEWVENQYEHLRIISDNEFTLTQAEFKRHTELYSFGARQSSKHLLSGILYCAHCGTCFSRKKRSRHVKKDGTVTFNGYAWVCNKYNAFGGVNKKGGLCKGERTQVVEDDCIKAIQYEIKGLKKSNTDDFFNMYVEEKFKGIDIKKKSELEKKNADIKGKIDELLKAKLDGLISEDLYREQMKGLNEEFETIKADLSRIAHIKNEKKQLFELYENYKKKVQEVDIDNLTSEVLKGLFYKIYVSYKKDSNGKKTPTLRFVYKFLDSTNDDVILNSEKLSDVNAKIFQSVYLYKQDESIDDSEKENAVTENKATKEKAINKRAKKLF